MDKGVPGMDLVTGVLESDSRLRSSPSVLVDADSLLSLEGERDLPQGRDSIGKCICLGPLPIEINLLVDFSKYL